MRTSEEIFFGVTLETGAEHRGAQKRSVFSGVQAPSVPSRDLVLFRMICRYFFRGGK